MSKYIKVKNVKLSNLTDQQMYGYLFVCPDKNKCNDKDCPHNHEHPIFETCNCKKGFNKEDKCTKKDCKPTHKFVG